MITSAQLKDMLTDLESDRIERTITTTKLDKFAEAVCAFANDFPHYRQLAKARSFDALPCLESTLADLSEDRFVLAYLKRAVAEEVIA